MRYRPHYPAPMSLGVYMHDKATLLLLAAAALGSYVASHASADAMARGRLAIRARAVGHWIPILIVAIAAIALGQPQVAVGVLFGTSVAVLSLVLGIVTCTQDFSAVRTAPGGFPVIPTSNTIPHSTNHVIESDFPSRRVWAFVLPAALIALLAGFSGRLTLGHALFLLIEGFAILLVWQRQRDDDLSWVHPRHTKNSRYRAELILSIMLAAVCAAAGVRAAADIDRTLGLVSSGFVPALMLSPALVLPMIGSGMSLARSGFYQSSVTMSVGIVLLNLCFGLPLIIGLWQMRPVVSNQIARLAETSSTNPSQPATTTATVGRNSAPQFPAALRYPLGVWRIDTVVLILLGLILLPLSVGRWPFGRFEGILLIIIYIVYMGLTTWSARA